MNVFLTFAFVFLPVGWFIYRMIRYTAETVGDESPVYRTVVYQITFYQYFVSFPRLLAYFLSAELALIVKLLIHDTIKHPANAPVLLFFLIPLGLVLFLFYFDWQYWELANGVTVTLNPDQPSITVETREFSTVLTPSNLAQIQYHTKQSNSSKDILALYGYLVFKTVEGQSIILNDRYFSEHEFLERYFKTVPFSTIYHKIPWISEP